MTPSAVRPRALESAAPAPLHTFRRGGGVSFRYRWRVVIAAAVLLALIVAVAAWTLLLGDFAVPAWDVFATTFGFGDGQYDFVVRTLRLPRALVAIGVGVALACSGTIFQSLVRNPLVAPDIIGVMTGASLVAVVTIVVLGEATLVPAGALAGAIGAALLVYALTWRGGITGNRLVLVGIGINAVFSSLVTLVLVRFPVDQIAPAVLWTTGSLYGSGWRDVRWLGAGLLVLLPAALLLLPRLRALQLGDDAADALGVRTEPSRAGLLLVGASLAAVAVAVAGPLAFVALVVPHAARLLFGPLTAGVFVATGLLGALLVLLSDLVAQHLFSPLSLPVGVVTAAIGAPYFLFLLYRSNRGTV